ncbi:MAG: DUF362 domain-containing protein [candidate division KSB1 bacterium]|nr:DUF362 domain-containing protein [candidate division KSB1 bacterium]
MMKANPKLSKLYFPLLGLGALIWFLVRVIPKPSRAAYPCMRAAFPLASAFVLYLLGLATSAFAMTKVKNYWKNERYWAMAVFLIIAIVSGFIFFQAEKPHVYANSFYLDTPNQPMGVGQGIFPGRVVWAWNPDATNENCKNDSWGEAYHEPKNSNMNIIQAMVDQSLLSLTGQPSVGEAWNALFVYFNQKKGRGAVGYQPGQKIFIKTNAVSTPVDGSHNYSGLNNYTMAKTSPQPVLAILRQLVNSAGVPQENISVGDPIQSVPNDYWEVWHPEFPNVKYISLVGGNGRIASQPGSTSLMFYSDRGQVLRTGNWNDATWGDPIYDDKLYTVIEQADYMINVAALKVHERAGMTLMAKCHFGSHTRSNALHVHNGLVNPDGRPTADPKRDGYGLYRVLVDLMGHEKLGGNTILNVVDGLWGGPGANLRPVKFKMAPFNNDWPSSIFMSQDQVALESVCFDFLKAEFTSDKHAETYPQMEGVDDHLHQAADSTNWPAGIRYDPENDGTVLASLGVHEHWNNANDKKYSRDLGTGEGIELIKLQGVTSVNEADSPERPSDFRLEANYPNPLQASAFNPETVIKYQIPQKAQVTLKLYDLIGREVRTLVDRIQDAGVYEIRWDGKDRLGQALPSGVYFYQIQAGDFSYAKKMTLLR